MNSYILENLLPSTTYEFYVRNICESDFSEDSNVKSFTTLDICKTPQNLQLLGAGRHYVSITWNGQDESAWQVEYGPVGFNLGTGIVLNTSNTSPRIENGINSNTTYEFYVRANCGTNGYSNNAGPLVVSTQ